MSGHCCLFLSFLSFVYHRQVDMLAECVETKDADAQTDSSVLTRIQTYFTCMCL